jgi:KaiC/GvpD/RAD55 family RecA-like ATPase
MQGLDERLGGGVPAGAILLLLAPPGSGKTLICERFAIEGLEKGERVAYVSTSASRAAVERAFQGLGLRSGLERLFFVDCFSWRTPGKIPEASGNTAVVPSITDLNELTMAISTAVRKSGASRVVLDSLSDLLMYTDIQVVFKFLQLFKTEVSTAGASAVVALEYGLHEDKVNTTVNYVSDGVLEMRTTNERQLRVARAKWMTHALNWTPYEITKEPSIEIPKGEQK